MTDWMTDWILALVPVYGAALLAIVTFLSCMALPVPSSLLLLTAGAFIATGDLTAPAVVSAAWGGAVAGDQAGFWLGRLAGQPLRNRLDRRAETAAILQRAEQRLHRSADAAVFLSRWLFSALGPYINLIAGATRLPHGRFLLVSAIGEAVWVAGYTGAGYVFSDQIEALARSASALGGALAAGLLVLVLGRLLWRALQEERGS